MFGKARSLIRRWAAWRRVSGFTILLDLLILAFLLLVAAAEPNALSIACCCVAACNLTLDSLALAQGPRP